MKHLPFHLLKDLAVIWAMCLSSKYLAGYPSAITTALVLGFIIPAVTREQRKKESYLYFLLLGFVFWLTTAPILIPGEVKFVLWFASVPPILGGVAITIVTYAIIHVITKKSDYQHVTLMQPYKNTDL